MELFTSAHLTQNAASDQSSFDMPTRGCDLQGPCVSLHFRYGPADAQFFHETMPVELAGLPSYVIDRILRSPTNFRSPIPYSSLLPQQIPAEEFTSRIRGINMRLAKYRGHEDYGPIIRGVMIVAYLGVCIVLLCFVNQLPALVLWTAMFAGLFAVSAALLHFIKQKPVSLGENFDFIGDGYLIQFVRFVEDEVARFNQLDASRGVRWKSLREHNPALFALRYNRQTAQVPWRIAVFYLASESNDQPMEFLPAYEASHLPPVEPHVSESLSIDLNLLGKAPSYNADTTVPMIQLTEVPPTQIEEIMPSQAPAYASQSSLEGRDE